MRADTSSYTRPHEAEDTRREHDLLMKARTTKRETSEIKIESLIAQRHRRSYFEKRTEDSVIFT